MSAPRTLPACLPRCFRCGAPGEVPVRPHGIAYCGGCYCAELAVSVDTGLSDSPR